jgi:hypothetical protein
VSQGLLGNYALGYDGSAISARVAPPTDSRTFNHGNESPPLEEQPGRDKHESPHRAEREAEPKRQLRLLAALLTLA